MISQSQVGGVQAGEKQTNTFPNYWNQAQNKKPGIVYCHGGSSDGSTLANAANYGEMDLMTRISQYGYPAMSQDHGGIFTWGSQLARDGVAASRTYGQANLGWAPGKCWLMGTSMGGLLCMGELRDHPNNYFGAVVFIGAVDLAYIRDNNINGAKAGIDTAWGLGAADPLPVGANPPTSPQVTLPVQYWYVPDDIFTPLASINNIPNWCPNVDLRQIPSGSGHNEDSVAKVVAEDIRTFMRKYSN